MLSLAIVAAALVASAAATGGVLINVPFVAQQKNACGAASIAMVMQYWQEKLGVPRTPASKETLIEAKLDPHNRGITNSAIAGYLRANGYRVFTFAGRWSDFRENLSKGRPLIVAFAPEGPRQPLHYAVVAGIDWQRGFVFLNDPAQRKLFRMPRTDFERDWNVTGRWTLLAVPNPAE